MSHVQTKTLRKKNMRGIALIIVLLTASILGAMLAVSVPIAQVSAESVIAHNERLLNYYLAESAISRGQLLLINDVVGFKNRQILSSMLSQEANENFYKDGEESVDRFVADKSDHALEWEFTPGKWAVCNFQLEDAVSDFNFTGNETDLTYRFNEYIKAYVDDDEKYTEMQKVYNEILDYADKDNNKRVDGMEREDYLALDLYELPRNGEIETVEELMLIPGARRDIITVDDEGLLENVRVGLSPNLRKKFSSLEKNTGSGSFASAGADYIASRMGSTVSDLDMREKLNNAIQDYRSNGTALYENLDADALNQLKGAFSDAESGLYTITAVGGRESKRSQRKIKLSFVLHSNYKASENFCYMLHRFYFISY